MYHRFHPGNEHLCISQSIAQFRTVTFVPSISFIRCDPSLDPCRGFICETSRIGDFLKPPQANKLVQLFASANGPGYLSICLSSFLRPSVAQLAFHLPWAWSLMPIPVPRAGFSSHKAYDFPIISMATSSGTQARLSLMLVRFAYRPTAATLLHRVDIVSSSESLWMP